MGSYTKVHIINRKLMRLESVINMNNELEIIKRKTVEIFSEEELDKKINSGKN